MSDQSPAALAAAKHEIIRLREFQQHMQSVAQAAGFDSCTEAITYAVKARAELSTRAAPEWSDAVPNPPDRESIDCWLREPGKPDAIVRVERWRKDRPMIVISKLDGWLRHIAVTNIPKNWRWSGPIPEPKEPTC